MTAIVLDFPSAWYSVESTTFSLRSRSQVSNQTWIGGKNVYGPHAQLWVCKFTMTPQIWDETGQAISAFFSRLDGQAGYVRIGHHMRMEPRYNRLLAAASQTWSDGTTFTDGSGWQSGLLPPTVKVAAEAVAGDNYLVLGGLPASTPAVLQRGDLIELRPNGKADGVPRLHEVMHDAPTNANGETGFEIRPRLRAGVAANDMAVLNDARSIFHCIDDEQGAVENSVPGNARLGFTLVEALDLIP